MMDAESQKIFNKLVSGSVEDLSENDKAILRARQDYLSDQDRKKFASVLEAPVVEAKPVVKAKSLDRKDLEKAAKKLGVKFDDEITDPQLRGLIDNAKFEKEAAKEEADAAAKIRKSLEATAKKLKIGFGSDATNEDLIAKINQAQGEEPEVSEEE